MKESVKTENQVNEKGVEEWTSDEKNGSEGRTTDELVRMIPLILWKEVKLLSKEESAKGKATAELRSQPTRLGTERNAAHP